MENEFEFNIDGKTYIKVEDNGGESNCALCVLRDLCEKIGYIQICIDVLNDINCHFEEKQPRT